MNEPVGIQQVLAEFTRRFAPHFPPVDGKTNLQQVPVQAEVVRPQAVPKTEAQESTATSRDSLARVERPVSDSCGLLQTLSTPDSQSKPEQANSGGVETLSESRGDRP